MPTKEEHNRGIRAGELLCNDAFADALNGVMMQSLEVLSDVDATNVDEIRTQQATIKVLRNIKTVLEEFMITGGQVQDSPSDD